MKPIQDAIESLHAKGLCPRLHVDVTHADAVCPDFVRDKWKQQLVIDLDPSYPLDLGFTKIGVEADLSFGGYVTRCVFPWAAIYIVADREAGRSQVFATNIPASLRHKFAAPVAEAPSLDPSLTEVRDDVAAKKGSRRRKRNAAEASPPIGPVGIRMVEAPSPDEDEAETEAEQTEAPAVEAPVADATSVDQTAQTRRSAFRVIEGGG